MSMLGHYRVLDLTRQYATLTGQIYADLGADVIQLEPPGGAPGRTQGPYFEDRPDADLSLSWWAHARGKRSVELDIASEHEIFCKLLERADLLIWSGSPAERPDYLHYDALARINPGLVTLMITPYGLTGPKAHWAATDLTLMASAGPLAMTGDEDRPPVRVSVPQAWQHAAAEAAVGGLVALTERKLSGLGQQVEVSVQQAVTLATQGNILAAAVGETTATRIAGGIKAGDVRIRLTYPAKDGFVSITHIFGATVGPATRRLMEYVYDQGFCDAATRDKDWVEYGLLLATGKEPLSEFERVKACVAACTASKTKDELLDAAMQRRLLLAPMTTIEDVAQSAHFAAREFFTTPDGNGPAANTLFPGAFARFSATPLAPPKPPPALGEHTRGVLEDLDAESPRIPAATGRNAERPLEGVKILDFMWALAGPGATRMLADYGATIIRLESSTKLDVCRTIRPFIQGDELPENSAVFHTTNAGKRMLSIDLTRPEAKAVVHDLVRWADVVTESYSPRAMKAFGLDYASLQKVNPELIMLSTCLMGQTGPLAMFAGYGNLAAAIAGFYTITGWPDREPAGPFGAYTDYIAPRFNAVSVLAALEHRDRTGEGQHIDLSQAEAAMHFLSTALLDYTVNGRVQSRNGNADPDMSPHGVYPVAGEDAHIAIACENDTHWQALLSVLPELGDEARFKTHKQRLQHRETLDKAMANACQRRDGSELEQALQTKGIPASRVMNSPDLIEDPQLKHLNHFVELPHPEMGQTTIEGPRFHLSRSPASSETSAPTFSRDMMYVLEDVLGYDNDRIGELLVQGIFD